MSGWLLEPAGLMTLSYDSLYQAVLKMLEGFGIEAEQQQTQGWCSSGW